MALANELGYHFIDNEDLFFPKSDPNYLYAFPRSKDEVEKHLIDVPKEVRLQRVKNRSFQKFGNRMLPGGDLYEEEKNFFDFVESKAENTVEEWLKTINCPVIRVDGTKPVEDNIKTIIHQMQSQIKLSVLPKIPSSRSFSPNIPERTLLNHISI